MKKTVLFTLIIAALISFSWVLVNKFEGTPPQVDIRLPSQYLNRTYELSVDVADQKSGLRKVMISIMQTGKEKILLEKSYQTAGLGGLLSQGQEKKAFYIIPVESWKYGMADGEAVIRVMVSDSSWRNWGKGNVFYSEQKVMIDTVAPKINILTKRHNIERGGAGLVIYRLFEKGLKSGVRVGDNFFPGYSGLFQDEMIFTAFFALSHEQGPGTQLNVVAQDPAGNEEKSGFYHYIRDRRFKTDTLNISDQFLGRKIPDFKIDRPENELPHRHSDPVVNKFLYINGQVRQQNVNDLLSLSSRTDNTLHWQGRFLRLKGSARRAGFADKRIYKYEGKEVDRAYHLGVDLASVSNAQISAANSGKVIFAGFKGIFGNTVVVDHGFGLASLYAHLTHISVQENDMVEKGQAIGSSGLTGLAGGDHLHFSIIVHNVFVNPVEWWDSNWIKNNITSKIEEIKLNPKD
jgi:murein DD-endopeptidase MepM/ murein hydrolase activator NlpD